MEKNQKKNILDMNKSNKKIIFVTTSRSEFGQFSDFLINLSNQKNVDLRLVVSGSHLFKKFGSSYQDIKKSGLKIKKVIKLKEFSKVNFDKIPIIFSKIIKDFQRFLISYKPDYIMIPCDRYEMLIFSLTAFIMRIPIIHFYGGEISHGAIDNITRNQISLMSEYHFVSSTEHKNNLLKIGVKNKNIFNIGALSIDGLKKIQLISLRSIEKKLKISLSLPIVLVTFHPVTLKNTMKEFREIVSALKKIKNHHIIFTGPNNDPGHEEIENEIKKLCKSYPKKFFHFPHLGRDLYFSLIKLSKVIIGNSSSLLYEVPYFKKISLNIGDRQKGRLSGPSVFNLEAKSELIYKKINNFDNSKLSFLNPFYKKNSASICINIFKKKILL